MSKRRPVKPSDLRSKRRPVKPSDLRQKPSDLRHPSANSRTLVNMSAKNAARRTRRRMDLGSLEIVTFVVCLRRGVLHDIRTMLLGTRTIPLGDASSDGHDPTSELRKVPQAHIGAGPWAERPSLLRLWRPGARCARPKSSKPMLHEPRHRSDIGESCEQRRNEWPSHEKHGGSKTKWRSSTQRRGRSRRGGHNRVRAWSVLAPSWERCRDCARVRPNNQPGSRLRRIGGRPRLMYGHTMKRAREKASAQGSEFERRFP